MKGSAGALRRLYRQPLLAVRPVPPTGAGGAAGAGPSNTARPASFLRASSCVVAVVIAVHRSGDLTRFEAVEGVVPLYLPEARARQPGVEHVIRSRHLQTVVGLEPLVALAEDRQARARDRPPLALERGAALVERERLVCIITGNFRRRIGQAGEGGGWQIILGVADDTIKPQQPLPVRR